IAYYFNSRDGGLRYTVDLAAQSREASSAGQIGVPNTYVIPERQCGRLLSHGNAVFSFVAPFAFARNRYLARVVLWHWRVRLSVVPIVVPVTPPFLGRIDYLL